MQERDRADDHERRDDHPLDYRLVVPLTDECPQPLVLAERREHHERDGNGPPDRVREQVSVAVVRTAEAIGEPQPESQVVSERDQEPVDDQLGHGVPMNGEGRGSDPPAHAAGIVIRIPVNPG
jgi:hypothetical protein